MGQMEERDRRNDFRREMSSITFIGRISRLSWLVNPCSVQRDTVRTCYQRGGQRISHVPGWSSTSSSLVSLELDASPGW